MASLICLTFEQNMSCNQHFRRKMAINVIDEGRQMIMRDDKAGNE
jgi:hypothetical protein